MSEAEHIGKYKILGELGRGAMGVVYRGFDPLIEREVAIKTLRADMLENNEQSTVLERFKKEAQAAGRLSHPNIVQVYEYGIDGDRVFIAMELINGKDLKDYIAESARFSQADIIRIVKELLDALGFAHNHGVVHRDIKPGNIVVLADGHIKVTDFGIARLESSTLTQAGNVLGTPSYMSPEQFMAQRVDGRSDLYSAGVVLYELLTGEKPFAGNSFATIMHKVLREAPIPPSELNITLPASFDQIVAKALAKRPDDRYQDAAGFSAALDRALIAPSPSASPRIDDATVAFDMNEATLADATLIQTPPPSMAEDTVAYARPDNDATLVAAAPSAPVQQAAPAKKPVLWYGAGAALGIAIVGGGIYLATGSHPAAEKSSVPTGTLAIDSDPSGAVVLIDGGKFGGVTPAKIALPVGVHQIVIRKEGRNQVESSVDVAANQEIPFQATLSLTQ